MSNNLFSVIYPFQFSSVWLFSGDKHVCQQAVLALSVFELLALTEKKTFTNDSSPNYNGFEYYCLLMNTPTAEHKVKIFPLLMNASSAELEAVFFYNKTDHFTIVYQISFEQEGVIHLFFLDVTQ